MEPIRILQIVPNMQFGGLETLIMNLYRNIDRTKVQFDFLVHYKEKKFYDDEIEKLGGKIYRFSLRDDNNLLKYKIQLKHFFKEHKEYKVIHCHMSSIGAIIFKIAKKSGIQVRIAHSHNSSVEKSLKGKIKFLMMKPLKKYSTLNYACSKEAGKFLFGNRPFEIFENAIDTKNFQFNLEKRLQLRKEYNIPDNCFVMGNVGRFNIQKNHIFLLKVFKEFRKNCISKLLLIGSGEKENEIKNFIQENQLNDDVIILQNRKDVNELYNMMDCFVLPSLFEGLPLVLIEAQANGLTCYVTKNITREADLSNNLKYLNIDDNVDFANQITKDITLDKRKDAYHLIEKSNFNITIKAKQIENKYIEMYNSYNR